jgi:UDP-glucose 4-epimerase
MSTNNLAGGHAMAAPVILVTGGAGFIGSHTVDKLLESGARVVVLDNFSTGRPENLSGRAADDRLRIVEADIAYGLFAPLAPVSRVFGPISHIIHLAAQTAVAQSVQNPLGDIRINYQGTVQVLEYARCHGIRHVVFASSSAVYGDEVTVPIPEQHATRPMSPYGIDKLGGEKFMDYFSRAHAVPAAVFRFFNVYGPRQDPKSPYSGVISIFAERALAGQPLTIYGDGEQTRDFVYVTDIARTLVQTCLGEPVGSQAFNLGTGVETSINALGRLIIEMTGSSGDLTYAPARLGDITHSVADISRAANELGFRPEVALREGLQQTLAWMRGGSAEPRR